MSEAMTDQLAAALDNLFKLRYDEDEGEWDAQEVDPRSLWPVLAAARRWASLTDDENVEAGAKWLEGDMAIAGDMWLMSVAMEPKEFVRSLLAAVRDRSTG